MVEGKRDKKQKRRRGADEYLCMCLTKNLFHVSWWLNKSSKGRQMNVITFNWKHVLVAALAGLIRCKIFSRYKKIYMRAAGY